MSRTKKTTPRSLTRREFLTRSTALGFGLTLYGRYPPDQVMGQVIGEDPQTIGLWEGWFPMPTVAVHAALLPTGNVLFYRSGSSARILNWSGPTFTRVGVDANIFCSGHCFLSDGTLLVVGGGTSGRGLPQAYVFDPFTSTWTPVDPPMAKGRWYPSAVTLPGGRVLVMSGTDEYGNSNNVPEIYTPGTGWEQLTEAQLTLPTYPYLFVLPDRQVFYAGPGNPTRTFHVRSRTWSEVGNSPIGGGSAIMYEPGKVMKCGGGEPANARTVVIDMNEASPVWQEVAPMKFARRRQNLTVLPDGKVLVTGGTGLGDDEAKAVYEAELWNPATKSWSTMARMQIARMYHSTALLLPDARVLSAGGNGKRNAEIYSPPYLFQGPRPEISSAPDTISYGGIFEVSTPNVSDITSVALIRPSAVTHAYNQDQRYLQLNFEPGEGVLRVSAPLNAALAPHGFYMLFLVANGVPSVAWFLRLAR